MSFIGRLTCKQHAKVSYRRTRLDNRTCSYTETEVPDQTCYPTWPQYTDTWPTGGSADPVTPCAMQGSHLSTNFSVTSMTTLLLSTAYTTLGVAGRKRRLSAARRNAWAEGEGGGMGEGW